MKPLLEQIQDGDIPHIPDSRHIQEHLGSYHGISYADVFNHMSKKPQDGWSITGGNAKLKTIWFERESDRLSIFFHVSL